MSVILRMLIILYNQTNTLKDIVIHLNIGLFISNPEQLQRRINVYRWVFRRGIPYFNGHDANLRQAQVCLRILRCGLSKRYAKHYCYGRGSEIDQSERAGVCGVQGIPQPHAHPNKPLPFCLLTPGKMTWICLLLLGQVYSLELFPTVLICIFVYHCLSDYHIM